MKTSWKWATLLGCALPAFLISSAGLADEPPGAPQPGTWQKHEYTFAYMGFTSTYSCDGLADRLKLLLIASGARKDVKSRPGACASGFGHPDKFARADLTFYTLSPDGGNGGSTVAGIWRSISLTDHRPMDLRVGDCELVEQYRNSVLPMFSTQNIVNHTTCVPHQESGSVIDLRFDAFGAAPPAGPAKAP